MKKTPPAELDADIAESLRAKKWQDQVAREDAERRARIAAPGPTPAQLYEEHQSDLAAGVFHGERRGRARQFREANEDEGIFYLTDTKERPLGLEFRSRSAAKRAALKLVRDGTQPRIEVWHRWRGDRYMQGLASEEGWSDV